MSNTESQRPQYRGARLRRTQHAYHFHTPIPTEERRVMGLFRFAETRADNNDDGSVRVRVARVEWLHRPLPDIG